VATLLDRAWELTTTPGTGTVTLSGSAIVGYRSWSAAGAVNATIYPYVILDINNAWEVGTGTYTSSGTTLSRTLIASSTGSLLSLSGAATVMCSYISGVLTNHGVLIGTGPTINATAPGAVNTFLAGNGPSTDPNFRAITLASADFNNQGSSTTVLHGNGAGPPSWAQVNLVTDVLNSPISGVGLTTLVLGNPGLAATLTIQGDNGATALVTRADATISGGALFLRKARGTNASPTVVNSLDTASFISSYAYNGSAYTEVGRISCQVTESVPGTGAMGSRQNFYAVAPGTTTLTLVGTWDTVNGLNLSTDLSVGNGGTGASTLTNNAVLIGQGINPVAFATIGTLGRRLTDQGAGNPPAFLLPGNTVSTNASAAGPPTVTIVMMGLAGAITPNTSGRVLITIYGNIVTTSGVAGVGIQYFIRWGTGTAPINGAANTGLTAGLREVYTNPSAVTAANVSVPFCISVLATALTIGTPYWIDLAAGTMAAVGASFTNLTITAIEV
jgi:hypothetical protein